MKASEIKPSKQIWFTVKEYRPPENILLMTKIDDEKGVRNEQKMEFYRNLWWINNKNMYVYYTPTHWRMLYEGE